MPISATDPTDVTIREYGFILAVALLGGVVSWVAKVRQGTASPWNVMQFVGELATSAFAGLLCFWLCTWAGSPQMLTAALVGVAGHMGTRAIVVFEQWAERKWGAMSSLPPLPPVPSAPTEPPSDHRV